MSEHVARTALVTRLLTQIWNELDLSYHIILFYKCMFTLRETSALYLIASKKDAVYEPNFNVRLDNENRLLLLLSQTNTHVSQWTWTTRAQNAILHLVHTHISLGSQKIANRITSKCSLDQEHLKRYWEQLFVQLSITQLSDLDIIRI